MLMSTDPLLCSTECISDYLLEKQNWMHIALIHVADELHFSEFSKLRQKTDQTNITLWIPSPSTKGRWQNSRFHRTLGATAPLGGVTKGRRCHHVISWPGAICQISRANRYKHPLKKKMGKGALTPVKLSETWTSSHKLFSHKHPFMLRLVKSSPPRYDINS